MTDVFPKKNFFADTLCTTAWISQLITKRCSGISTDPHLHLTTKKDGKVFDPVILLNLIQKRNIYYYKS